MPRGQPDYGLYTETPVASGISDPGEAAARLGGINVYDRRGWVVWMDDFESPVLKWHTARSVGGTIPTLHTTRAWMGIQSVRLFTAAVAGEWTGILKYFPLLRLGRLGIEFFVYLVTTTPGYLELSLEIYDGANRSTAELRLESFTRTATIVTPAGNIVVATNCFNPSPLRSFIPVKLVVDMDTDLYTRLLIGPEEIDLSAHSLVAGAATTNRLLNLGITLRGDVVDSMYAAVDNFILTQTEP